MSLRPARRGVLALCLAAALPCAALAGGLYRWVTKDGRVEVGPFPPPGVHAEPWQPENEAPKPAPAAPPAAEPGAPPAPVARPVEPRRSALELECEEKASQRAALARKRAETEARIAQLEATIAKLDESLIAYEESHCSTGATNRWWRNNECLSSTSFDRDASLEKARRDLDKAQSKLGDIERLESEAAEDGKCASLPAARAR